jgi:hypothetical protein
MNSSNRYLLGRNRLQQWILVWEHDKHFAWSGSRWVPIIGDVQICNFESPEAAHFYAIEIGLEPGNVTVQQ